jgi:hypothetical protein
MIDEQHISGTHPEWSHTHNYMEDYRLEEGAGIHCNAPSLNDAAQKGQPPFLPSNELVLLRSTFILCLVPLAIAPSEARHPILPVLVDDSRRQWRKFFIGAPSSETGGILCTFRPWPPIMARSERYLCSGHKLVDKTADETAGSLINCSDHVRGGRHDHDSLCPC